MFLLDGSRGSGPPTASPSGRAPHTDAPATRRRVHFTRFTGEDFRRGELCGTRLTTRGLEMTLETATREYVDPYGDASGDPSRVTFEQSTWRSPLLDTPFAPTELIGSWAVATPGRTWVEVVVRGVVAAGRTPWLVLGRWCDKDPADGGAIHRTSLVGQDCGGVTVLTDLLQATGGGELRELELEVRLLRPVGTHETPVVRSVACVASALPDDAVVPVSPVGRARGTLLDVPSLSQEVHRGHYPRWNGGGKAWCSPTAMAMVVQYWGASPRDGELGWVAPCQDPQVEHCVRRVFDYAYAGCGNWSFNAAYAASLALEAFVTRLRSLTELEELVRVGIPVVISVAFADGELQGAGYGSTGHLMVVVGFTPGGDVVVNDPGSHMLPDDAQVRTTYLREQLENAWLPRSGGTVYVVHPPSLRLPPSPDPAEPAW